eukprot:5383314-Pleurochrysis_carterae.AAC.1
MRTEPVAERSMRVVVSWPSAFWPLTLRKTSSTRMRPVVSAMAPGVSLITRGRSLPPPASQMPSLSSGLFLVKVTHMISFGAGSYCGGGSLRGALTAAGAGARAGAGAAGAPLGTGPFSFGSLLAGVTPFGRAACTGAGAGAGAGAGFGLGAGAGLEPTADAQLTGGICKEDKACEFENVKVQR